jgi:hypothetical protein
MKLRINENTSIKTMAMKTLTMPFRTAMGMLVSSFEARRPNRIGIKVIKKPNVAHLKRDKIIS